jgi:hypothetical protein
VQLRKKFKKNQVISFLKTSTIEAVTHHEVFRLVREKSQTNRCGGEFIKFIHLLIIITSMCTVLGVLIIPYITIFTHK